MKQVEQRRIVPMSYLTIIFFMIFGILQVVVIAGVLEIKSSTVKRIAPWAYEPFLRFMGEHPDSRPRLDTGKKKKKKSSSGIAQVAGFTPDQLDISLDAATGMLQTNTVIDVTIPTPEQPEIELSEPEEDPEGDVPVG